jgi:hypothetical protein
MNNVYKHSGRFTLIGIIASVIAGMAAAFLLAFIYAWGIIRIPEVKLACIATIFYGGLLGAATGLAAKWGKVRNVKVAALAATCTAVVSLYCSWAFWVQNIFHTLAHEELSTAALIQNPYRLWDLMKVINDVGTWGMSSGSSTKGTELWVIWGLEGATVLTAAALAAVAVINIQPFCESCQLWCSATEKLCLLPISDIGQIKSLLEQHDLSFLQKLGPGNAKTTHLIAELHSCPNCGELNTPTLRQTFMQPRKFGARSVKVVNLASKIVISRQEADAFRHTAENIKQLSKAAHA